MTDDVLLLSGQRVTRLRDAPTGRRAAVPDLADLAVLSLGTQALARTPSAAPVVRGTRPAPGCTVAGGGAFEATPWEAYAGPFVGALRTGLPTGLVGLGDVPTGRAAAVVPAVEGERR